MKFKEFFTKENLFSFIKENKKYLITVSVSVLLIILAFFGGLLVGSVINDGAEVQDKDVGAFNDTTDDQDEPKVDTFVNSGDATTLPGRSYGIDVSKWQGLIDWKKVKDTGIQFAIIRVGCRGEDGVIREDENAGYNIQEAYKNGIMIGAYFFSTARSEEEVIEEAEWTIDYIKGYGISYPVVYDCEGFKSENSRMYNVTAKQRTDYALKYLDMINEAGYDAMFYGARNDLQNSECWETERIASKYKLWVAIYSKITYPVQDKPEYDGRVDAWQFTDSGRIDGINTDVDLVVCYFNKMMSPPKNPDSTPDVFKDYITDGTYLYKKTDENVTAKYYTNLREGPSLKSKIVVVLENGTFVKRVGISSSGWSMLEINGQKVYADSAYLIREEDITENVGKDLGNGFYGVDEYVTAKIETNIRTAPSVEESEILYLLKNGEKLKRIGINEKTNWSMLEYDGKVAYAVTSYLLLVDDPDE